MTESRREARRKALKVQRGSGMGRDQWAIRRYLAGIRMTMSGVARLAGTHPPVVGHTVRGVRNHGRVLAVLEELGCPRALLYPREGGEGGEGRERGEGR